MDNLPSQAPLMSQGLRPADHLTIYHTSNAPQRRRTASNPSISATFEHFQAFSGYFPRGSQKTSPKSIYPLPLPDTPNFLSLGKKPQFFGDGRVPGKTITITSTKKIKIQK
jgi:hypothetical protein